MMQKLYKFHWDCGRSGDLEGVFVANEEDVQSIVGKRVYFGEVLGKHSCISGTIDEGEITVLTDDADFIKKAIDFGLVPMGFNPFNYLEEE